MNKWDVFKFEDTESFADLVASLQRNKAKFHTKQDGNFFIIVVYSSYTN